LRWRGRRPTSQSGARPGALSASPAMGAAPARSRRPGGGAMTDNSEPKIIPFGKYKGRLVEEGLIDDPD